MPTVASWIRECDDQNFRRFFEARAELGLVNARVEHVDLSGMDALLLTGGEDISAGYLRQPVPDPSIIEDPMPHRDAWEFEAARIALEKGLPVFAVCRGHQLLNVALGGTLRLDIPGHNRAETKTANIQPMRYSPVARHRIENVNSSHHQAIDHVAEGLEVEGWSALDDVIEQVRLRNYPFAMGVQYHPERDWIYENLFADFFDHILKR